MVTYQFRFVGKLGDIHNLERELWLHANWKPNQEQMLS